MSRKISNSDPIQKYCKVCQDAGKSESEYRSHFTRETRDPNSRVLCPTLLSLECRFCFKNGHTVKYCKVLKEKNAPQAPQRPAAKKAEEKPKGRNNTNPFICLDSDSEEDEEIVAKPAVNEEFPALSAPKLIRTPSVSTNYAAALSKAPVSVPKPVVVITDPNPQFKSAPWASEPDRVSAPLPPIRRPMTSWADDTDSDDEEDLIPSARVVYRPTQVDDNSAW